jgi:hypothetical protein
VPTVEQEAVLAIVQPIFANNLTPIINGPGDRRTRAWEVDRGDLAILAEEAMNASAISEPANNVCQVVNAEGQTRRGAWHVDRGVGVGLCRGTSGNYCSQTEANAQSN